MAARGMSHAGRLRACVRGESLDRPPVALWRHFPVDDQTPEGLAAAILDFQRTYDFDLVKVTPASSFCLKDWGVDDEWRGHTEGTRDYTRVVIKSPKDWEHLTVLDPKKGHLAAQIKALEMLVKELGPDVPVIQTIFNPLAQAKNLIGKENLLVHIRRYPEAVHAGLRTITESTRRFIDTATRTGIAGIFYAVQHANYGLLTGEEYRGFGRYYDLQVLEAAEKMWLNMLHLHGEEVMFEAFLDYPIAIINWHDQETHPSLSEAQGLFPGAVCGGLQREHTLVLGTPEQVRLEAQQAILATHGERFILGTGCVTPITAPHGNLLAARRSVEN
jgi:uroporphyrinogen decarboxylase